MIQSNSILTDFNTIVGEILRANVIQATAENGLTGPRFDVVNKPPAIVQVNKGKPVIYYHQVGIDGPVGFGDIGTDTRTVSARIGVKRTCDILPDGYHQQIDTLINAFGPQWDWFTYNFTINGTTVTNLSNTGIYDLQTSTMIEIPDTSCNCIMHEFRVNFTFEMPIHVPQMI